MVRKSRFLELVEQNQDIVHKICGLYAVNMDERKDLSQEIVYQLWKSYKSFRGDSKFTTWMYKVALNTVLLNLRRSRSRVLISSPNKHQIFAKTSYHKIAVNSSVLTEEKSLDVGFSAL